MSLQFDQKFDQEYLHLVDDFVMDLRDKWPGATFGETFSPFLPKWGRNFDLALMKIAVVGIDTLGWTDKLHDFVSYYPLSLKDFLVEKADFQEKFKFLGWGYKMTSFWGFWFHLISNLYGVDIKDVLQRKRNDLVDNFVWGNCNAIEIMHVKNPRDSSYKYASAKSKVFNSVDYLIKIFGPKVIIVLNAEPWSYLGHLDNQLEVSANGVGVYKKGDVLVLQLNHPSSRGGSKYKRMYDVIALLKKYGKFCSLENALDNLSKESRKFLVHECARFQNKYDAIGMVALELCRQRQKMKVLDMVSILNEAGFKNTRGGAFSLKSYGPYKLTSSAYQHFKKNNRQDVADAIAVAFTDVRGNYAYR